MHTITIISESYANRQQISTSSFVLISARRALYMSAIWIAWVFFGYYMHIAAHPFSRHYSHSTIHWCQLTCWGSHPSWCANSNACCPSSPRCIGRERLRCWIRSVSGRLVFHVPKRWGYFVADCICRELPLRASVAEFLDSNC
jgi:hypothetical protein